MLVLMLSVRTQILKFESFEKCWMLWAGTPQVVYVDPGTEYTAEAWQDRMQRHDIHVKVSASEAHWQVGRVEISRISCEEDVESHGFGVTNKLGWGV